MSQKASTHLIVPEPSEELISSEPWSIETYADGLMDDLFADIDHILDGSDSLSSHTVAPKYIPMQTVQVSPIVLPNTNSSIVQGVSNSGNSQLSQVVTPTLKRRVKKRPLQKTVGIFGRLFSVFATLGLAVAGIVWVLNSGLLNRLGTQSFQQVLQKSPAQLKPAVLTKKDIESDLASYILGALAVIERQEARNYQKPSTLIAKRSNTSRSAMAYLRERSNGNLPPPRAADNTAPAPRQSTKVVERIYIPMYQAPLPMRYAPPAVPTPKKSQPAAPKAPQKNIAQVPASKPASGPKQTPDAIALAKTNLKPVKVQTSPIAIRQSQKPKIAPPPSPVVPQRNSVPPPPKNPPIKQLASASIANPAHILEGLLELGDKSAALFKINGVTRRIEIGESIGNSGWKLTGVEKGKAVIRRNGEVRDMFVGHKF
ncbi:MAG: hypothetical protein QNJ51_17750 [Calothrix sp. MO_167.B12]|nr:hypothetical protein [Calothrix sp. MO_167.B12]